MIVWVIAVANLMDPEGCAQKHPRWQLAEVLGNLF